MDPQQQVPGFGSQQPGTGVGLPPIHTPPSFQAPSISSQFTPAEPSPLNTPTPAIVPGVNPVPAQSFQASAPSSATTQVFPLVASQPVQSSPTTEPEDVDTPLDEAWAAKAQEIIERHRADPFVLSEELDKLKIDYLKRRYNKNIKAGN